jgi:heat shock protein HslJ
MPRLPLLAALALAGCAPRGGSTADTATATPTVAAVPAAASRGIVLPFRARGNEPGWSLEVRDREMTLVADYGERRVVAPTPVPTSSADTTRWATSAQGHKIVVTVVDRLCHDGMSGFAFPRTVAVRLDDRDLQGCGGESVEVLVGPAWTVRSIDGTAVPAESPPTLTFTSDGRVSGRAPCNRFSGGYTLRGEELAFSELAATRMACAPDVMQREQRFLALLAAVRRFERTGDALSLRTEDGRAITARR